MRILVTGATGFVGRHLLEALQSGCGGAGILATAKFEERHPDVGTVEALDVTDRSAVTATLTRFTPTHIIHLAAIPHPQAARREPDAAWLVNVHGTLNLARAVQELVPRCLLLFISSGQVYGTTGKAGKPLDESALLAPADEYSATKAAAELALGAMTGQGLRCLRFRPFNHAGPGQTEDLVLASFAMQIARIEQALQPPVLRVGNLDARRDFLDVRDVVAAYVRAVRKSEDLDNNTIMNLASGRARRIGEVLDRLISLSSTQIRVEQDPARMRPSDLPVFIGNAGRARRLLDWKPEVDFDTTLADLLADCRRRVSGSTKY